MNQPQLKLTHATAAIALCSVVWLWSAIHPWNREAWILEQMASLCALTTLIWCHVRGIRFSTLSQWSIACMFIAHTIGTHYTYSLTPYDAWFVDSTGISINATFGWERNHYDRFVHLLFGIALALPVAEAVQQRLQVRALSARLIGWHIIVSASALYELAEWAAAVTFGTDLGNRYLGTQGDVWDAQADMALAAAGGAMVYLLCGLLPERAGHGKPTIGMGRGRPHTGTDEH